MDPDDDRSSRDEVLDRHEGDDRVGRAIGSGVRWMGSTQVAGQAIRIVMVLVLTRLLTPSEFGLVSLVMVVTGFFDRVLGDTGTTSALVRHPTLTRGLASSIFWWNLAIGACTSLAFVVLAAPIAHLLGQPDASDLVAVAGLSAFINAFGHVQRGLLRRTRRFNRLAIVNMANATGTAGCSIGFALAGWGAWALVVGSLCGSAVSVVLAWVVSGWRPSFRFSREALGEIRGFSVNLSVQNLFGYLTFAGDRFIVGRFIGTTALGYYGLANRLLRYPLQTSAQTYREVVFPTLARLQHDDKAMLKTYRRTVNGIAIVLLPVCFTIAALADPLVRAVLGEQWIPATDVIAIMALVGALQSLTTTTGSIYLAKGRTDLSLRWQMFSGAFMMASYSIGAIWGVEGVAWGFFVGIALLTYPSFAIPLRLIGARPRQVLGSVVPTAAVSVGAAVCGAVASRAVENAGSGAWTQLIAGVAACAALLGIYIVVLRPRAIRDLLSVVRRRPPSGT